MTEARSELTLGEALVPVLAQCLAKIDLAAESQPYFKDCQIEAAHDLEAVRCWLQKHASNQHTVAAYERQAKLFLMWCCYERGKTIGQLKAQDFEAYFSFLQNPPEDWCTDRASLRQGKRSTLWRPMVGPFGEAAVQMAFRILKSLISYLADSQYLSSNPLKLIKIGQQDPRQIDAQKYRVWARMLEEDEWQIIQQVLNELPEENALQVQDKLRVQFLFGLLYFLGLRIHEAANHTWSAFQFREGCWWFFVKGKGGRLGHIPVHEKLMTLAKLYRSCLHKDPLPDPKEQSPLLLSLNKKPIQIRQLYQQVKKIGNLAAVHFKNEPHKAAKLKKLSPHWLRHLCASHQDKAGISPTMIKENLRHRSHQTTQLYLHTEENLRHQAIQKMSLKVEAKGALKKSLQSQIVMELQLTKGPIHKGLGFKKLLEVLETEIFAPYEWRSYQFEKAQKIKEIESSILPVLSIVFAYVFENVAEAEIQSLEKIITVEAKIRLFNSKILIKKL